MFKYNICVEFSALDRKFSSNLPAQSAGNQAEEKAKRKSLKEWRTSRKQNNMSYTQVNAQRLKQQAQGRDWSAPGSLYINYTASNLVFS